MYGGLGVGVAVSEVFVTPCNIGESFHSFWRVFHSEMKSQQFARLYAFDVLILLRSFKDSKAVEIRKLMTLALKEELSREQTDRMMELLRTSPDLKKCSSNGSTPSTPSSAPVVSSSPESFTGVEGFEPQHLPDLVDNNPSIAIELLLRAIKHTRVTE